MTASEQTSVHLLRAAERILRPLARILLRNGIPAMALEEVLRKTFVDVAFDEFRIPGKSQTLARVSVITGLNRKEVARLHNLPDIEESDVKSRNRAATVVTAWLSDGTFHTAAGFPLDLAMAGPSPNFPDLVKRYSGDMYPNAVADELLRLGAVERIDDRLRLLNRGYVPGTDPDTLIDFLGMDTAEFIETVDHNIQAPEDGRLLQYKIVSDNLSPDDIEAFNRFSRLVVRSALEQITDWLNRHDQGKAPADGQQPEDAPRGTAGIGFYHINRLPSVAAGIPNAQPDADFDAPTNEE